MNHLKLHALGVMRMLGRGKKTHSLKKIKKDVIKSSSPHFPRIILSTSIFQTVTDHFHLLTVGTLGLEFRIAVRSEATNLKLTAGS